MAVPHLTKTYHSFIIGVKIMLMEVSRRKLLHRMHTKRRKAGKKGDTVFDKILCSFLYISKRW